MPQELEVIAALANIEHGGENNAVLEMLGDEVEGFHVFKFNPEPGAVYAAVNWRGVLSDAASVAGIASLLWQIYSTQVATQPLPEKTTIKNNSGETVELTKKPSLFVQLKGEHGEFEQFNISGNYESKEIFVSEFTEKVERLRACGNRDTPLLESYERSERWLRIK